MFTFRLIYVKLCFSSRKHPGFSCYQMIETTSRFLYHTLSCLQLKDAVSSRTVPSSRRHNSNVPPEGYPARPHAVYRCLHSGPLLPAVNLKILCLTWVCMWGCFKMNHLCVVSVLEGQGKILVSFSPLLIPGFLSLSSHGRA